MSMTKAQVLKELKGYGSDSTKKIFLKHGAKEPFFGVKVVDLKKIGKKIKGEQELALELFETGNGDAMYLAGLIADGGLMNKSVLKKWAKNANWYMISEYTVAWVSSENDNGWELALEWIDSKHENIATSGWATLAAIIATRDDEALDIKKIKTLMTRVKKEIHKVQNRVRYTMNGFMIAVATYVVGLTDQAVAISEDIGKVNVEMGGTACKVPYAPEYIENVKKRGGIGRKRKTAKC